MIREDQQEWLEDHPEVNLSGYVQKQLNELMKEDQ